MSFLNPSLLRWRGKRIQKSDVRTLLHSLPPIAIEEHAPTETCKMCGRTALFFCAVDYNQYCSETRPPEFLPSGVSVSYYRCRTCEFLFTRFFDNWTSSDFSKLTYNDDYAKIDSEYATERPRRTARDLAFGLEGAEQLRILDYGSGSGAFADEMRKHSFRNVTSFDPYSNPIKLDGLFDVITCFEVVEHSPDPTKVLRNLRDLLAPGGLLVIGQTLHPADITVSRSNWWYLGPRNGHMSTFSSRTFKTAADRLELGYREGSTLYAFTRDPVHRELERSLERISPYNPPTVLFAPGVPKLREWHEVESLQLTEFRWSRASVLRWPACPLPKGWNEVQIPCLFANSDGLLAACTIEVDGQQVETSLRGRTIVGRTNRGSPSIAEIAVRSPEPQSPFDLRGEPDHRLIGIAVLCR